MDEDSDLESASSVADSGICFFAATAFPSVVLLIYAIT